VITPLLNLRHCIRNHLENVLFTISCYKNFISSNFGSHEKYCAAEMEKRGNIRRLNRVVLVPGPFQGHINPMLQLGTILHSHGFSITVVHAQYNSPKPSSHPDFSFLPLPDTSSSAATVGEFINFTLQLNTNCKARFQECLAEVMRQLGPYDGIACIIYDQLMYFSEAAAKDLKLPCIVLRTGSAAVSLAGDALFQLKAEGHIPFPGIFNMKNDTVILLLTMHIFIYNYFKM
jgi:hypothetical protein